MRTPIIVAPYGHGTAETQARIAVAAGVKLRDWALVEDALMRYGYYLELIDPLKVETGVTHTFTTTARVVH